jgi:hypothetical protein
MLIVLAALFAINTASLKPPEGLDLVVAVPFPAKSNAGYAFAAIPGRGNSDALVFIMSVYVKSDDTRPVTLRYDPSSKEVKQLKGYLSRYQQDCGVGLAVIESEKRDLSQTIDVATGRVLSEIDTPIRRTGILGFEESLDGRQEGLRLFDVRTGDVLRSVGAYPHRKLYIGAPAWDDGHLRMYVRQATKPDGSWTDGQVLMRMKGRTFEPDKEVLLFSAALGFDKIIGNPNSGHFAVEFSNNRRASFTTYSNDLVATKHQVDHVLDVSRWGVLGRMLTKENEDTDPELGRVGCWNPDTGKLLWQAKHESAGRSVWLASSALVGSEVCHPVTGEVIATVPSNRTIIAASGQTIWTLTKGANQKFEVWRVR